MIHPPIEERDSYILETADKTEKVEIDVFKKDIYLACEVDQGAYSERTTVTLTPAEMRELAGLLITLADKLEGKP